jgi:multiple sugar transport system permease protein
MYMKNRKIRGRILPYGMLLPMIAIMLGLVYYPIMVTLTYSVQNMELTKPNPEKFVGLNNYGDVIKDPQVRDAFFNSLYILVLVIVLTLALGLAFSLLLKRDTKIKGVLMGFAIVPWALPPIVNGVIWRWVFHPNNGIINRLFHTDVMWLTDKWLILSIVALVVAWRNIPLASITFLSAMQNIPRHLYEAAEIDGSGPVSSFGKITMPLLRPAIGIILTTTSINALNVFDEIISLSGFANATKAVMVETYLRTFKFLNFGDGSALIYIMMVFTSIFGAVYARKVYKEVEYI